MKIKFLAVSVLLSSLVGCASVNNYAEPEGTQVATVSGSSASNGLFDYSNNSIKSIDNKTVGLVWTTGSNVNVLPGAHTFTVTTNFKQSFIDGGPYISFTDVKANVKANQHYQFVSKVEGSNVKVWAVDSFGRVVSNVGTSSYQVAPRDPVILPHIYLH